MQNKDNYYWKKGIVRKRVPNQIQIRVVTLLSKDVSDRNRQKLRFPEISQTNRSVDISKNKIANKMRRHWHICRCDKIAHFSTHVHFAVISNLSKWLRASQIFDKEFFSVVVRIYYVFTSISVRCIIPRIFNFNFQITLRITTK